MPVRPSFGLGERADFGFGLGDALRRGKALLRRVFATGLLASTSLSRVTTHVKCDDFLTSSPMTIFGLLGGAMVVSSNRWVDRRPFLRHLHYLAVAPPPLLVNRIVMRRVPIRPWVGL